MPDNPLAHQIQKSHKLDDVCYDIRGEVLDTANHLEDEGHRILKLNIGNPAPFGFNAPDEIITDMVQNLRKAQGYTDSKGLFAARKAIQQDYQLMGVKNLDLDHIYLGNGVSELIVMAMQGLLNTGDEILIPAPDYPLWTAAVNLSGGTAVHYRCDEQSGWQPDIADIRKKITSRTKGLVLINPNNPTGAVYTRETLTALAKLASEKNFILFADEIYSKILYDGATFTPMAKIIQEDFPQVLCLAFNGLSKNYRAAGFRCGWMTLHGNKQNAASYIEGLTMLASMRLCANVPAMFGVQTALGGHQSIHDLTQAGGRLHAQRELAYNALTQIPGLTTTKPDGAFYFFPKLDVKKFNIKDDQRFILDFLKAQKVLLVHGSAFNWPEPDHFRLVFLPQRDDLLPAINGLKTFLQTYQQS